MLRKELLHALEVVKPGVASKEVSIGIGTTSFAFFNDCVVSFNDEISIRYPLNNLGVTGAIKAEELYKFVSKLKQDEIEAVLDGNSIVITSGRSKAGFAVQQDIRLPLSEISKHSGFKPLPENFIDGMKFTMATCERNSNRVALTCINIRQDGLMESSDNYRISRYQVSEMPVSTFLLPVSAVSILIKYDITEIAESKGWVHFKTSNEKIEISCRVVEDHFPATDTVFDVSGDTVELPILMQDVLEKAIIFCADKAEERKFVTVSISDKRMKIRVDSDTSWFEEDVRMAYKGEGIEFHINPSLLKLILAKTRTCTVGKKCLKFSSDTWQHVVALVV